MPLLSFSRHELIGPSLVSTSQNRCRIFVHKGREGSQREGAHFRGPMVQSRSVVYLQATLCVDIDATFEPFEHFVQAVVYCAHGGKLVGIAGLNLTRFQVETKA